MLLPTDGFVSVELHALVRLRFETSGENAALRARDKLLIGNLAVCGYVLETVLYALHGFLSERLRDLHGRALNSYRLVREGTAKAYRALVG